MTASRAGGLPAVAFEIGQFDLEKLEIFRRRTVAGERVVHGAPELGRNLIVFYLGGGGRAGNSGLEDRLPRGHEGLRRRNILVVVERGDRRHVGKLHGAHLLGVLGRHEFHQLDGRFLVGRVFRDREVPAAERRGRCFAFCASRQRGDAELALDGAIVAIAKRVGVWPVAHEDGIAGLPDAARFLFLVGKHALGRDGADPAFGGFDGRGGLFIVDGDIAICFYDVPAAGGCDPFQRVAGQTLIGAALENKTPEVLLAGRALLLLNFLGGFAEFLPGLRWLLAVFFKKVLAIEQCRRVGKHRHGNEFAVHRLRGDDRGEMISDDVLGRCRQIHELVCQLRRPDNVRLVDVDVLVAGGKPKPVLAELFARRRRHGHQIDLVPAFLFEGGNTFAEKRDVLSGGIRSDGNLRRLHRNSSGKYAAAQEQSLD
ncbi:Hypothetical protein AT6N2_L0343 [Agrobacterium tumefaciens]|nr:Hypothetical protein AT6N2_L0343 [Agrobacterium tumefaciens]